MRVYIGMRRPHMPNIGLICDINLSSSCTKTGGVFNLSGLR